GTLSIAASSCLTFCLRKYCDKAAYAPTTAAVCATAIATPHARALASSSAGVKLLSDGITLADRPQAAPTFRPTTPSRAPSSVRSTAAATEEDTTTLRMLSRRRPRGQSTRLADTKFNAHTRPSDDKIKTRGTRIDSRAVRCASYPF